jgi:hypothetical protein
LAIRLAVFGVLVALFAFGQTAVRPASAQAAPVVADGGVQNNFPQSMVFSMTARSDSTIQKVRLRYKILPDGAATIAQPDFVPGKTVSTSFELAGNNPPNIYVPPGATIEYHWEVTDEAGNSGQTPTASFFYDDIRFHWQPVQDSGITIYYYSGSETNARDMLATAVEAIGSASQLLGARVDFPVKVWVYDNRGDMLPALARRSATFEQTIVTAGVRVASDTVLVLGNASFDTLRHELTHVVTAVAGESALGTLPLWLDEGTAVYGEDDPGGYRDAVEHAIGQGNVLSVRSLSSPAGDPDKVELFYGESWSLVKLLNDTYGQQKFAQLFATIKKGKRIDDALQTVYGFDQDGLEDKWRAANGLPPRPTPEPTQPAEAATPTTIRAGSPSQSSDSGRASAGTIAAVALGVIALAGAVGFAGFTLARRYH